MTGRETDVLVDYNDITLISTSSKNNNSSLQHTRITELLRSLLLNYREINMKC